MLVAACVLFVALMIPLVGVEAASSLPVDEELGRRSLAAAPLNPAFVEFRAQRGGHAFLELGEDGAFGDIPAPSSLAGATGDEVTSGVEQATPGASYDLRALGRLTSVKNQGSFGTCWAFASCGSLESGLMPGENLNFSEDNMVLKSGFGPSAKATTTTAATVDVDRLPGSLGRTVYETDDAYGDSYTPSGLRPAQARAGGQLDSGAWLGDRQRDHQERDHGVRRRVRLDVLERSTSYYKPRTASYYYPGSPGTNHAVLIVGWDDNYPASNFCTTPAGNGAVHREEQLGHLWGDSGYFYVSYYDSRFGRSSVMAVFSDAEATSNYAAVYQYDPLGDRRRVGVWEHHRVVRQRVHRPGRLFTQRRRLLHCGSGHELRGLHRLQSRHQDAQHKRDAGLYGLSHRCAALTGRHNEREAVCGGGQGHVSRGDLPDRLRVSGLGLLHRPPRGFRAELRQLERHELVGCDDLEQRSQRVPEGIRDFGRRHEYTLNTSVVGNGSIGRSPDQTTYAPGTEVTLTATPASGWLFDGWSGGASGSINPLTVTMNASKTITATFVDSAASTRYEETNSLLTYAGTWSTLSSSGYSGGSLKRYRATGGAVTVAFEGTELTWIVTTGSAYGKARLTLDGGTSFLVDLYSSTLRYKQGVYSTGPLSRNAHSED